MKPQLKSILFSGFLILSLILFLCSYALRENNYTVEELRELYGSGRPELWPRPFLFNAAREGFQDIGPLPAMVFPEDNPWSEARAELGKELFFDPQLSESGKISCAACHLPSYGFADYNMLTAGHEGQLGLRNVLTVINSGYFHTLFWDGRVSTLEEQVKHPLEDPREMNFTMDLALERVKENPEYRQKFREVFGSDEITAHRLSQAIATYERTLVSGKSRFDLFVEGKKDEFSNAEVRGLHLFRTKANCVNCHNTPFFSDQKFYNIGLDFFSSEDEDMGLYELTGKEADRRKFRTPSLRELTHTSPYMHNGQFPEIRNVLMMYNAGMGTETLTRRQQKDPAFPKKSNMIKRLDLTDEEISDLAAFLRTLSSDRYKAEPGE